MSLKNHVGLDSFIAEKTKLLNAYDTAKDQNSDDAVRSDHGGMAEGLVREWLRSFLPKRFGVTKGYIITPSYSYEGKLEEWDVIIFDALESPVLYTKGDPRGEPLQAIPIEYVRGVIEVKATLNRTNVKKATAKLLKLRQYLDPNSSSEYPSTFQLPFVTASIFVETDVATLKQYRGALDAFIPLYNSENVLPYMGACVFRSHSDPRHVGVIEITVSDGPHPLDHDAWEQSSEFPLGGGKFGRLGCLMWGVNNYQKFIFDLLGLLRGARKVGVSSFYGMDFENSNTSRLFWNPGTAIDGARKRAPAKRANQAKQRRPR